MYQNWEQLSGSIKEAMSDIGTFFCKMHLLVNFPSEADKVLKVNEKDVRADGKNPYAYIYVV